MALNRTSANRFSATIWPGFVDAMTALLMVMMFVLTIFVIVQAVLREQITSQDGTIEDQGRLISRQEQRLNELGEQVTAIGAALSAAEDREAGLEQQLADQTSINQGLENQLDQEQAQSRGRAAEITRLNNQLESRKSELAATTASLEESRRKAEETLTLLAAAEAAREQLDLTAATNATEAEKQAALLATAQDKLSQQDDVSAEDQRRIALLNEQVAGLTAQLSSLQAILDTAGDEQKQAELRVGELGRQLNAALLRAAEEKQRRLTLEEAARVAAEAEARDLARYRSEFFGRLSQILSGREGVKVVGDRFVFQSEVLFAPGEANLSQAGQEQVASVADMLTGIADEIPPEIDWIIRVDGHTDSTPLSGTGRYRDNWELSQARALAVVRYLTDEVGFPADRLAATGFSDTRPVAQGDTTDARAQNRRIELKLTER